jgi:stress response protein YsnF
MTDRFPPGSVETNPASQILGQNAESSFIEEQVLPLYSEELSVSRRKVERGVRVHVRTISHDHLIDGSLAHEMVEVERVAIGRPVDAAPPVREEGDTTVISVVEEILVVERRLILKEEIRLRRSRVTEQHREIVTLREQQVVIERTDPGASSGALPSEHPQPMPPTHKDHQ